MFRTWIGFDWTDWRSFRLLSLIAVVEKIEESLLLFLGVFWYYKHNHMYIHDIPLSYSCGEDKCNCMVKQRLRRLLYTHVTWKRLRHAGSVFLVCPLFVLSFFTSSTSVPSNSLLNRLLYIIKLSFSKFSKKRSNKEWGNTRMHNVLITCVQHTCQCTCISWYHHLTKETAPRLKYDRYVNLLPSGEGAGRLRAPAATGSFRVEFHSMSHRLLGRLGMNLSPNDLRRANRRVYKEWVVYGERIQ